MYSICILFLKLLFTNQSLSVQRLYTAHKFTIVVPNFNVDQRLKFEEWKYLELTWFLFWGKDWVKLQNKTLFLLLHYVGTKWGKISNI